MLFTESSVKSLPLCCISGFILVQTQHDIPVILCVRQMLSLILCPVSLFQKFGSNQSKPEFTVDLRGGTVEWASKDKSSKKHVIEVLDPLDLLPTLSSCFFQSFSVQTCQNKLSCFGFLSFPPLAEDPSGNRAPDTVWDRQCHQWLVPRPYRDHQHTCEWRTQKLYL